MPLPLFPFQEAGAAFLASRERAGLFDEPGVGKTAQAVRALDLRGAIRGVVVAPAATREAWRGEFLKFQRIPRRTVKGVSIHDFVAWANGRFDVLVTSYDMFLKWGRYLDDRAEVLDFLVLDEAHYLKDDETARARVILGRHPSFGATRWAECAWWLTGTPVPNDPADIYTFMRFVGATRDKRPSFVSRYFSSRPRTYSSTQTPRKDKLPELQGLIGANSLRRRLIDTGVELPPIFLTETLVDGDAKPVRELLLAYPGLDAAIREALEGVGGGLSRLDADHVATLRRLIGEAKAVPYAAYLLEELRSGLDKCVVFGVHRLALLNVRDYLWSHGVRAVLINGDTPEAHRQEYMSQFQSDPNCRVLIGNIRAAGVGLTLTASCNIDMLESDWTPAGNAQALKRVHRFTQTRRVRARFITLADSFDQIVNSILAEKTAKIALLGDFAA